jgi:membrane protein insertase Oxa1/YidC/SpoIIIJ
MGTSIRFCDGQVGSRAAGWFNAGTHLLLNPTRLARWYSPGAPHDFVMGKPAAITVIIKIAFFPLANKSYASMAKMKAVQPQMLALRKR